MVSVNPDLQNSHIISPLKQLPVSCLGRRTIDSKCIRDKWWIVCSLYRCSTHSFVSVHISFSISQLSTNFLWCLKKWMGFLLTNTEYSVISTLLEITSTTLHHPKCCQHYPSSVCTNLYHFIFYTYFNCVPEKTELYMWLWLNFPFKILNHFCNLKLFF